MIVFFYFICIIYMPVVKNIRGEEIIQISNLADLELSAETINLNTDGLEATMTSIDGKLPTALTGGGNLKVCIQELGNEGSERLNVDIGTSVSSKLPTALTGSGNLKVSIQETHGTTLSTSSLCKGVQQGTATERTLLTDANGFLVVGCGGYTDLSNISSHHLALIDDEGHFQVDVVGSVAPAGVALASHQTTAHSHQTTSHSKQDTMITHLSNSATSLTALDNAISGNELQVDVITMPTTTVTGTVTANLSATDNAVLDAMVVDLAALEVLQTATNGLLTTIDADTSAIKTAVEILDNTVSGNEMQVDVVSMPTTTVTGTVTANLSATDNAVLDSILVDTSAIKTAVEILDNTVSGSEMQVDVISMPTTTVTGTVTANLSATDNAVLDASLVKQTALETLITASNGLLTTIDADTSAIKTAVEILDNTVSGNEMQVDVVSMPTTTVTGTVTANLSATDNAVLDASLVKQTNIETLITASNVDLAALEVLHTATNQKLGDIETAVQLIDDAVHAEDTAHSSGHKGVLSLAVRSDTKAATGADGDYVAPTIDANGDFRVHDSVLENTLEAILAKAAPVKAVTVMVNNVSIGGSSLHTTASALDCSTVKHVGFSGSDTSSAASTVQLLASATDGGTYIEVATGSFNSGVLVLPAQNNTPFKFFKIAITNNSGGSSDYTVNAFTSS